jgi:hypothetical protein
MTDSVATDFDDLFQQTSTYIQKLIERETLPFQLSDILNSEVPAKIEDTRRSLVAVLEERLAERGEIAAAKLNAQLRIRYYEDRIESNLSAKCQIMAWTPWTPSISEYTRKAGAVLTVGFSIAAVLAVLRAAGVTSIKTPLYVASPGATAVINAALAVLSGIATTHPEVIPLLMRRERSSAIEHVAAYLWNAQRTFLDSVTEAEKALDAYFDELRGGNAATI